MQERRDNDNPFLIMGFWEFTIIATLMTVFFPWSLLFCVLFYGIDYTKLLVIALFHDFMKTLLAVVLGVFSLALVIFVIIILFAT